MTSRFAPETISFLCLNGPKQGDYVNAPAGVVPEHGSATAVPWFDIKHIIHYCVYVVVEHEGANALMFVEKHDTPERAQAHVHRIAQAMQMAREVAARN